MSGGDESSTFEGLGVLDERPTGEQQVRGLLMKQDIVHVTSMRRVMVGNAYKSL